MMFKIRVIRFSQFLVSTVYSPMTDKSSQTRVFARSNLRYNGIISTLILISMLSSIINVARIEAAQTGDINSHLSSLSAPSIVIDEEIFTRSVPSRMVVGTAYTIVVVARNTGSESVSFLLDVSYPFKYSRMIFYSPQIWQLENVTLDPGSSQRFEYAMTPLVKSSEDIVIEARILSFTGGYQFSSVSAIVHEIRTAFPKQSLIGVISISIVVVLMSLSIAFWKRPSLRLDITIALLLFTLAFLLRAISSRNFSPHNDESILWAMSLDFLVNDWEWSKHYMRIPYPPGFFYLLAGVTYLFEFSLMAVRNISILSGSLTVVVLYFLAKSLYNRKAAFFSALLLCFSSYHIYYSGIAVTDALIILLILSSVYFFWVGWNRNVLKFCSFSGLLLGLAFNIKYIVIVIVPATVFFILWSSRSLRSLMFKGFITWAFSFLVAIAPVQIILFLNDCNPIGLYLEQTFGTIVYPGQKFHAIHELIPRGLRMFIYSMARSASPWLPWLPVFEIAICVSLIIIGFNYAFATLKGQPEESYLFILMAAVISLLIDPAKHNKWLMYSFPFYFTMMSNIAVIYTRDVIRKSQGLHGKKNLNLSKVFTLIFIVIFAFSSVFVGISVPFLDDGEYASIHSSILYVRDRVQPGDLIAGIEVRTLFYYLDLYELDAACVSLKIVEVPEYNVTNKWMNVEVNKRLLTTSKPRFLIENRAYFDYYYDMDTKEWIYENYHLRYVARPPLGYNWVGTEFYESLVFERKS